jgi:YidC/Oxa1 family membrane protein insertase
MNPFSWIFTNLVYLPQLNLLQFLYNVTGDIGLSIILLAVLFNLLLWPLFASTYLNAQKLRVLQPELKKIQAEYKDNREELLKRTMEFNKKHKINNGSILWVLIGQILVASGLWVLTNDVASGKTLTGLYPLFFNQTSATLSTKAFGLIEISKPAQEALWLPVINMILSYLYGVYTFRWAPKPKLLPTQETPKEKPKDGAGPALDPEVFQKTLEFQTIYIMPIFLFVINLGLNVGVNIYFIVVSAMSLVRQVFLTNFYLNRTDKLIEDIIQNDPELSKKMKVSGNQSDLDGSDILDLSQKPTPTLTKANLKTPKTSKKSVKKSKTSSKSQTKKLK